MLKSLTTKLKRVFRANPIDEELLDLIDRTLIDGVLTKFWKMVLGIAMIMGLLFMG